MKNNNAKAPGSQGARISFEFCQPDFLGVLAAWRLGVEKSQMARLDTARFDPEDAHFQIYRKAAENPGIDSGDEWRPNLL